ncbi:MAG: DUF1016 family protein [Kiritimatiellae bacterium]|nr:DUF1016 family protein [Kiritimatiellia bacterium]
MNEARNYDAAVQIIKTAILQSQYDAARSVNEKQLTLYYGIGKYISLNSRKGFWGKGAIDAISDRLQRELPGLRGFTSRNLRYMRTFYEEWTMIDTSADVDARHALTVSPAKTYEDDLNLAPAGAKLQDGSNLAIETANLELASSKFTEISLAIWNLQVPNSTDFPLEAFLHIGFTHHRIILRKVKSIRERLFYIRRCAEQKFSVEDLEASIARDDYGHQGSLPNNFPKTLSAAGQALRAINAFKDEYLLDFINVEELGARDGQDVDERVVENAIVHNVRNFILAFGKDFTFVRNQYHLDAFGEDQYIDLLFFNRELNCLVAVELKTGKFKTSYLGQLQGYLSVLDGFERKPHENPSIGLILCKDMNKSFVDYVIQDYSKPMGVATYKTAEDMPEKLRKALPDVEDLRRILDGDTKGAEQ